MSITTIMKNSMTVHFLKKVSYGSRFLALARSSVGTVRKIIAGSRLVSFLKVGDYLDLDSKNLAPLLENAKTYHKGYHLLSPWIRSAGSWIKNLHLDRSKAVSWITETERQREEILTRRNIIVFGLAFLAAFYILRFLLLTLVPEGDFRISWSTGLLLTIMLIVVLLQLAPKDDAASASLAPGVIQNTCRIFIRLAAGLKRRGELMAQAVLNFIQRRKSGGNGL